MPSLKRGCASALMLLTLAAASPAAAEEASPETVRNARSWDAALRGGYGSAFTTGLSYLRAGIGFSVGHTFDSHLRLDVVGLSYAGESVRASNASITYRSSYSSLEGSVGAQYELAFVWLRIRPGVRLGVSIIDGHTQVGALIIHDAHWEPIIGPCLDLVARVGRFELGVAGEAFFQPDWVAAPTAGLHGIAGVTF